MKLIEVERLLGGQRMVVYFVSEDRVDFRELVKLLATEFQTRIEMKQVGVRDEAKILADYGDCGKPVCCNNHLVKMPPVSMRMAKLQKATLDPTKISGRCGRLKCCLRYEFDTYEEIQKQLPPIGSMVVTREGKGKVLSHQILAEQLLIETEGHRRMVIEASEVLSVIKKSAQNKSGQKKSDSSRPKKQTESRAKSGTESNRKRPPRGSRPPGDSSSKENKPPQTDQGDSSEVSSLEKSKRPGKRRRSRRRPKKE